MWNNNTNMYRFVIAILFSIILLAPLISADAVCLETLAGQFISCGDNVNCDFGVEEELTNISINFKSEAKLNDVVKVRTLLCLNKECSGEREQIDLDAKKGEGDFYTAKLCEIKQNCFDKDFITRSGSFFIKAIIDPNGLDSVIIKEINIKKSLEIELNCPLSGFIDRDIQCDFGVEDVDFSGVPLSDYISTVEVTQGMTVLDSTVVGGARGAIVFKTSNIGNIDVKLIIEKDDYLFAEDTAFINVQHPVNKANLFIDNKDIFDYSGVGLTKGTHQVVISVDKSGVPLKLNSIKADMISSSGFKTPLVFNRVDDNTFKTQFNFEEEGRTYTLRGQAIPEDTSEPILNLEYGIVVAKPIASTHDTSLTWIFGTIIGGVIIFLAIIVILGFIIKRKRKRK